MHQVEKKKKRTLPHGRLWLACGAAALLLVCAGVLVWEELRPAPEVEKKVFTSGEIHSYEAKDVTALSVTLRSGEAWTMERDAQGAMALAGEGTPVDPAAADMLIESVRTIGYEDAFTDDPADYAQHLHDFGLDVPRAKVTVGYADGTKCTLFIGDRCAEEDSGLYYMLVEGDSRLFALDRGTAETLMLQKNTLYTVTQPVLHKDRFDRITLTGEDGQMKAQWVLEGDIGGNAQDRWLLTHPMVYRADGGKMDALQENLQNIRLGAYVAPATEENLKHYGFDAPRVVIEIHQAAGAMGATDDSGVYSVRDWPEDTFTLTVGGAKSDAVDYVCVGEGIYVSSHYSMNVFMTMNPLDTLSRYAVGVALGNLHTLTVEKQGVRDVYTLTRTEQVAPNNDLVRDSQGQVVYDMSCTLNGEAIPYEAFEAAYNNLLMVTVSGRLPDGWQTEQKPHTIFSFEDVTGKTTTVELTDYDAMHDAVIIDGHAVFYLIKNGMGMGQKSPA